MFQVFSKTRLEGGEAVDPTPAILKVLSKHPLKSATSLIYAIQKSSFRHPSIDKYLNMDLIFLEKYHGYAVDQLVPEYQREFVKNSYSRLGIAPMTKEEELQLRSVGKTFWPEMFDPVRAGIA